MKDVDEITSLKAELGLDDNLLIGSASSAAAHYWALKQRGNTGMQYVPQADYIKGQQKLWNGNVVAWEADMLKAIKQDTKADYHYLLANKPEPLAQVKKPTSRAL